MNTIISTAAHRIVISAVAALALTALPQAGFAADTETGLWKINLALSKSNSRSSRLVIERAKATDGSTGAFVVINRGTSTWRRQPAAASSGRPGGRLRRLERHEAHAYRHRRARHQRLRRRCRFGEVSDRLTVTFRNTGAASETMTNVLALNQVGEAAHLDSEEQRPQEGPRIGAFLFIGRGDGETRITLALPVGGDDFICEQATRLSFPERHV